MVQTTRQQIRVVTDDLEQFGSRVVQSISLEVTAVLQETSPVDTGWFRANWVPSVGVRDDTDATEAPTPEIVPGQQARQQQAITALASSYLISMGSVFISNNVPYGLTLNEGSSRQAPAGFVQAGIQQGILRTLQRFRS